MTRSFGNWTLLVVLALALLACSGDDLADLSDRSASDPSLLDPTETDEVKPDRYRESLARDQIAPIYDPAFVAAAEVDWPLGELVIGVDIDGEQRAYPVGFLSSREMVIDNHRGIPTLVTW